MKVWKDYTTEDAITVIEKVIKAIKPEVMNFCGRKLSSDIVHNFKGFMTEPIKGTMKEIVDTAK